MPPEDIERLRHMLDAAREAISFLQGRNRFHLDNDRQLAMALVKEVEIIGEAANRITNATRREVDEIPWLDIIGMRNRLVHAYFDINTTILWKTLNEDLPGLVTVLESLLGDPNKFID